MYKLILPLILCAFVGCSNKQHEENAKQSAAPKTSKIEGSAFVVTKDGSTVKMILLEINLFKETELKPLIETNGAAINQQLQNTWASVKESRAKMNALREELTAKANKSRQEANLRLIKLGATYDSIQQS